MSVDTLLCEGGDRSPDVRVLSVLLNRHCEIKPSGGKYGMGSRIIARREVVGVNAVFGFLDGDFIKDWESPENQPRIWKSKNGKVHFGWRWERKEIENYLIDPIVVARALGSDTPAKERYKEALETARDTIALYETARTALSNSRIRFDDLSSSFGKERKGKYKITIPDEFDENTCRNGIATNVRKYNENQTLEESAVQSEFGSLLPEFEPSGQRYQHFLHAFAGKDLLWAMNDALKDLGFLSAAAFREKIVIALENTTDDIADYLPEWKALRETMEAT